MNRKAFGAKHLAQASCSEFTLLYHKLIWKNVKIFQYKEVYYLLVRWFIRFGRIRSFSHLCGSHDPDHFFSEFEKIVEPSNLVHELAISKFGKIHFDEEFLKTKANFGHVSKSEWKMKDLASKFVKMSYARSWKKDGGTLVILIPFIIFIIFI